MNSLIGKKVIVEAYFETIIKSSSGRFDQDRILLKKITVNNISFRDHTFIQMSKLWKKTNLKENSNVIFDAFVNVYTNKGGSKKKFGLRHVRNIRKNVYLPFSFDINSISFVQ